MYLYLFCLVYGLLCHWYESILLNAISFFLSVALGFWNWWFCFCIHDNTMLQLSLYFCFLLLIASTINYFNDRLFIIFTNTCSMFPIALCVNLFLFVCVCFLLNDLFASKINYLQESCSFLNLKKVNFIRRVWRYQRGNQNPYIEEEQTAQLPKEKAKKRSTKHTYKTKDRI